jgi:hypothetical protein
MYAIEHHVGRLIEIRIWSPVSVEEAEPWAALHEQVVARVRGSYLCLVDLVDAAVFPPDVVEAYVATMKNEPRLLRTATLLGRSPTQHLQILRMIREANHPARRAFRDPDGLYAFLSAVATPAESARLRELLARRGLDAVA